MLIVVLIIISGLPLLGEYIYMLKSKPGSFQPPVMVSLMTGEELEPRHWPKDWLWVNPLPPSLVVFTLATSVFWITTQILIQKFGMSTTQKLQSKFTTIFNNKVITGMLTFEALIYIHLNHQFNLPLESLLIF